MLFRRADVHFSGDVETFFGVNKYDPALPAEKSGSYAYAFSVLFSLREYSEILLQAQVCLRGRFHIQII